MIQEWSRYPEVVVPWSEYTWCCGTPQAVREMGVWTEERAHTVNPEDTHVVAHGTDMVGVNIRDLAHAIRDGESTSVGSRATYDARRNLVYEVAHEVNDVAISTGNDLIVEAVFQ